MSRVLVAMSGGVDSAVAAARLLDDGHDVTGVHLKLADVPIEDQVPGHGCCTLDDAQDARRCAQVLDIPFYVWDLSETFRREVQDPFAATYARGRTPNPCVTCNERVKYAALLARARELGFDALATGHHVRLRGPDGRTPVTEPTPGARLLRSADPLKDQTYVLYVATRHQLARSLFPVGELTKEQVRAQAEARGLRVATKPESYDVCFIPDGDTARYLGQHLDDAPGDIVDLDGRGLGRHDGTWRYTVGQRRGLNIGDHVRRFVVDVDADARRVVVGPREALACTWLDVDSPNWIRGTPPSTEVLVQIRAHGRPVPGRVEPGHPSGRTRLHLDEPVHGVALGQAAVVYRGDECLGGGRIAAAQRPAQLPVTP